MKTKTKLLSILLLIMLTQSCTKNGGGCDTPQSYYIPLTAVQLNQTPYFTNSAFDTISFASDKGDTLTFVKTKTDTTWFEEKGNGNPGCGYDRVFSQTLRNTYTTIKGNGSFDVKHNYKTPNYGLFRIEIVFNGYHFIVCECIINDKTYKNYRDLMIINGKNYNEVFFEYHELVESNISTGYFNKEFGLIHLVDSVNIKNYYLIN